MFELLFKAAVLIDRAEIIEDVFVLLLSCENKRVLVYSLANIGNFDPFIDIHMIGQSRHSY